MRKAFKRTARCQFQIEGFHRWKEAPEDVSYLRHDHRHMFHAEVFIEVSHNDREVEIITLQHKAKRYFDDLGSYHQGYEALQFGNQSCETLAERLGTRLIEESYAVTLVTVLEDNENGASIFFREADVEHNLGSTEK